MVIIKFFAVESYAKWCWPQIDATLSDDGLRCTLTLSPSETHRRYRNGRPTTVLVADMEHPGEFVAEAIVDACGQAGGAKRPSITRPPAIPELEGYNEPWIVGIMAAAGIHPYYRGDRSPEFLMLLAGTLNIANPHHWKAEKAARALRLCGGGKFNWERDTWTWSGRALRLTPAETNALDHFI